MRNENGFALIQIVVVMSIFSILSLAMSNLIIEQKNSTAYLEDQLEKIQLNRNFETILKDGIACQRTLAGITLDPLLSINISSLRDNSGNSVYDSNTTQGRLQIGQIRVVNDTVPGPSSSGFVDITIPISRIRKGGGPSIFRPLEFKVSVNVNAARQIIGCAPSGMIILESGLSYDGQTGTAACASAGKSCVYTQSSNIIQHDAGCATAGGLWSVSHCMRVCATWYNQSLPGIPNTSSFATHANTNIHSCSARLGYYTTYLVGGVVRCGGYFSAICI